MPHTPRETGALAGLSRKRRAAPSFLAPHWGRAGRSLALGALSCVLVWIAHTSQASRLARLASGGRHGFAQSVFQVGGNFGTALGPLLAAL